MGARRSERRSEAGKLAVTWTCFAINAANLYLLVFTSTSRALIAALFCASFVPYFLYVRYRTPPV